MMFRRVGSLLIGVVVLLSVATDAVPMTTNSTSLTTNNTSSTINTTSSATKSTPSVTKSTPLVTKSTPLLTNSTSIVKSSTPSVTNSVSPVNNSTSSVNSTKLPDEHSKTKLKKRIKIMPVVKQKSKPVVLKRAGELYAGGFSQAHPELCPAHGARLKLLVLVTSAPDHAKHRDAVRLTWGHYAARKDIALAFVLGAPLPELRAQLAAEDDLYGDIIIGNSIDAYSNLTLKTMSMLEWTATYCEHAPRLLKTDDDVFLNVPLLLSFMAKHANDTRTIWGKVHDWPPNRSPKSKYYLSQQEFSGRVLPSFATGPAYLLTADCVAPLLTAARDMTYLKLEDVFVTGVVASKLHIKRVRAPEFYNRRMPSPQACTIRRTIAFHMVKYHEQFVLWRMLLDGTSPKC